jgi:beta-N-acetylglucosaminidase
MKTLKIALGLLLLGAGLSACAENSGALYSSGDYYNSFGRGYYEPYQDGSTYHYHHSYFANAKAVSLSE